MNFKLKLVSDWRNAWKWVSIHCFVVIGAVDATWYSIPDSLKQAIPANYVAIGSTAVAALGILARVIDQGNTPAPVNFPDHHDHDGPHLG